MSKMNPTIKALWVTALLDGNNEQGTGTLTRISSDGKERNCCLGVLCKLAVLAGVIPEPEAMRYVHTCNDEECSRHETKDLRYGTMPEGDDFVKDQGHVLPGSLSYLPVEVMEWAGLTSKNPLIPSMSTPLSMINDNHIPFTRIAELIAKEL